ncbi:MAG: XcyI family restriction endonuclease [Methanothrix sp.]|jgi:hypothetical protein|nr:XcyI family restriction endonuclease [Methanothrix sp.]
MAKRDKKSWISDQITKSGFFHQKLHEWGLLEVAYDLEKVKGEDLEWSLLDLGITENAWNKIIHRGIKPIRVFAHPNVLRSDSKRISYYRMLSMASQKSMVNVGLRTNGYEGEPRSLDRTSALQIAKHLNSIICMLIEFDSIIDEREFDIWRGMAAGSQAQGSWQNSKGNIAEKLIKDLILKRIDENGLAAQAITEEEIRELRLNDHRVLTMGSEPDIALYKNGKIQVAIEIKGGIDTAGALERFGAALKSLNRAKQENPESITVLIVHEAALTTTANGEIENSKSIDYLFTIGDVISKEDTKTKLFDILAI